MFRYYFATLCVFSLTTLTFAHELTSISIETHRDDCAVMVTEQIKINHSEFFTRTTSLLYEEMQAQPCNGGCIQTTAPLDEDARNMRALFYETKSYLSSGYTKITYYPNSKNFLVNKYISNLAGAYAQEIIARRISQNH